MSLHIEAYIQLPPIRGQYKYKYFEIKYFAPNAVENIHRILNEMSRLCSR